METTSPSWIGYKWYKFTEQPAFARAKLSEEEATFLQGRVETLHKMLADGVSWGTLHNSQQQPNNLPSNPSMDWPKPWVKLPPNHDRWRRGDEVDQGAWGGRRARDRRRRAAGHVRWPMHQM